MTFHPVAIPASRVVENIEARWKADAEYLAGFYDWNVDALEFEYNRRSFGSYCTTPDGSPEQRDRYFRAWKLARERARHVEAAE